MIPQRSRITGCILAGGRGTRFGGQDKGLLELAGRPLTAHVIDRLQPQLDELILSVNRNLFAYGALAARLIPDRSDDDVGPLAGIAAALHAATTPLVMIVPCDSPFIPANLVDCLHDALLEQAVDIAVARTGERVQPTFALLQRALLDDLDRYLGEGGRKINAWYARHPCATVDFGAECTAFANINTAADLAAAAMRAGA